MDDRRLGSSRGERPGATASNSSTIYPSDIETAGKPLTENLEVTLKNFVINRVPEESTKTALDGMAIYIHGLEDNTALMEKIATRWEHHREIQLHPSIDKLTLSVQSIGGVGCVTFSKNELEAFMKIDHNIEVECEFTALEENGTSLKLTFTLRTSQNASLQYGLPSHYKPYIGCIRDAMKNPEMFSTALGELAEHPELLNWLGDFFKGQFLETNRKDDIDKAISAYKLAIESTTSDDTNYRMYLSDCGSTLYMRFEIFSDLVDINQVISMMEEEIAYTEEDDVNYVAQLNNLGSSFAKRFEHTGNLADIESAISTQKRGIQFTPKGHTGMPTQLNNLGNSFQMRFKHTGDLTDIRSAISAQQRAVQLTPEGHADMPTWLNNLGNSFQMRFEHTGDLTDITNAITSNQKAVDLTPDGHFHMPSWLTNLGSSFAIRFLRTGNLADIASAISAQQRAVQLTPEGYADMPSRLNNLGNSFLLRFVHTRDLTDVTSSISINQRAVNLTPDRHVSMHIRLGNLANSFMKRFEHTGDLADIASAIVANQQAVELTPDEHIRMSTWLTNLGSCFAMRFVRTGNLTDIASAISNQQRAVRLIPEGHAYMPTLLNNLASSFHAYFKRTNNLEDIANAISTLQKAIELTPEGHASMPSFLIRLARSLLTRFTSTHNMEDIQEGISMFRRSATQITGHPSTRLEAACNWAELSSVQDKSQLLDAYGVAIQLLPQVAGLEQTIYKRHQILINASDITASATAAAINNSEFQMALAWLEQGRCLVWNQINRLRTPAEDLRTYNPQLADRFLHVAQALEVSGSRQERQNGSFSERNMAQMISLQDEAHTHVHLAREWNELLQEIRRIPKFQDFLRPLEASKLLDGLPSDGSVVIFNIHEDRCDALALISGRNSPIHIQLKDFTLKQANQLRDDFRQYLTDHRVRQHQEAARGTFRLHLWDSEGVFMYKVLRELWEKMVKPILDAHAYLPHENPSERPRIWWCPTGPLAFLPIHAAGIYTKESGAMGPCVSDYVISSYTPTVHILLDKIKQTFTMDRKHTGMLIISQPSTPGQSSIPGAKEEAHALSSMIRSPSKSLLLEDASATVMRVKEEMKKYNSVHFACHAIQAVAEPLKSGVQLHDGRLEVLEIIKQTLPDADLAFLSACQTSTGDEKLSDEAIHLAASMLTAGYRSVVGTMWSIQDQYGPIIANDFYSHILNANLGVRQLDGANAARALHYATQKFRMELGDTEDTLLMWVPYVHFGV